MFRTILLELFLPFRPFKKTANIRWTTISKQILRDPNKKWRVAPKRKKGAAANRLLKSQVAQECGVLLADARQQ